METIYTQAVADAKAVRESAMANAKAAIQEAFEPKIKAMLKKHIVESEEEMDEAEHIVHTKKSARASQAGYKHASAPKGAIEDLEEYDEFEESEKMNEGSFTFSYNDSEYVQELLDDAGIKAMAKPGTFDDEVEVSGDAKAIKQAKKILGDEFDLGMDEAEHIVHTSKSKRAGLNRFKHALAPKGAIEDLEEDEYAGEMDEEDPGNLDEKYLDEILDELESMDEAEELDEAEEMDEAEEESEEESEGEEEDEDGEETSEEDTKVVDVTLGDLVNAIKAAMAGHEGGEGAEGGEDEVSLDEILAELEDEGEEDELEEVGVIAAANPNDPDAGKNFYIDKSGKKIAIDPKTGKPPVKASEKETAYKKELAEAKKAIDSMRAELNEINLLNAKLLYVNKIFKSKSLTEAQKVKVLNAFDRATSVKEVKNTFNTIRESISVAPKKQLKESFSGFASKPTGGAPKGNTLESDPFIARMQKLAGL